MAKNVFNYNRVDINFKKYLQVDKFLNDTLYNDITSNLPDLSYGYCLQEKYALTDIVKHKTILNSPNPNWNDSLNLFIDEVNSKDFYNFISTCFKNKDVKMDTKLWIALPEGAVLPHYDDKDKVGNIILYMDSFSKGGSTLFLDDKDEIIFKTKSSGNTSVFMRTQNNKHAVEENFVVRRVIIINVWKN